MFTKFVSFLGFSAREATRAESILLPLQALSATSLESILLPLQALSTTSLVFLVFHGVFSERFCVLVLRSQVCD